MSLRWGDRPPEKPTLRRLHLGDAPRAFALSQAAGWSHTLADWERLITWGGRGCFCIARREHLLATAVTVGYGHDRAWIGMVIVHPDHRRKGLGTQITRAAMEYLQQQHVERILLDASEMGRPLYEKLGFRTLYSVEIWEGRASRYLGSRASTLRQADLPAIIAMDADVFGVSRARIIRRLVQDFPHLGWVDKQRGQIEGFLLAQTSGEHAVHLGPWIHRSPWGAEKLLRTALDALIGKQVRVDIPDRNTQATVFAHNYDLRYQRHCTRMIYGDAPAPPEIIHRQYGVASLATG